MENTVNIYRQKTILAKGNTDEIPTTCKSFSLYLEFLQRLQVIYQQTVIYLQSLQVNYRLLVNYPQTLKEFQVQAKGFAGCGNFIGISFSQYSFLPINIYSVRLFLILFVCISVSVRTATDLQLSLAYKDLLINTFMCFFFLIGPILDSSLKVC